MIISLIGLAGVALVWVLFFFNLTVVDGMINGFIWYVNIVRMNSASFYSSFHAMFMLQLMYSFP